MAVWSPTGGGARGEWNPRLWGIAEVHDPVYLTASRCAAAVSAASIPGAVTILQVQHRQHHHPLGGARCPQQ
eukprot:1191410-Prorocentrum_minimum.AAC.6